MKYFLILIVIILGVGTMIYFSCFRIVEKEYFEKAALFSTHFFSRVKAAKGGPLEESWVEQNGWYYKKLVYEGYVYETASILEPDYARDCDISIVYITDPSYRIGIRKLGVGSTKREIKIAYFGIQKIVDIKEKNIIGFIDGGVWVRFYFTEDDRVAQISICYGP